MSILIVHSSERSFARSTWSTAPCCAANSRELRFGRMSELRAERRRLMAQLDSRDSAISSHSLRASNQQKGGAKVLQAAH